jgi:excisionase family DNA binding protein
MHSTRQFLTIPAAARELGVDHRTIRAMVDRDELPVVQIGRRRKIDSRVIDRLLGTAPFHTKPVDRTVQPGSFQYE